MVNKRHAWKISSNADEIVISGMSKHIPSPVKSESEPDWSIYFHARERKGKTFISASQSCDINRMASSIVLWVLAVSKAQGCDAPALLGSITRAATTAVKKGALNCINVK